MPAACGQSAEQTCLRDFAIEVKRLRIELRRKGFDLRFIDHMGAAGKPLADVEVLEEKTVRDRFARCEHNYFPVAPRIAPVKI